MSDIAVFPVSVAELDETYLIGVSENESLDVGMDVSIQIVQTDIYQGIYNVIPKANEETVLETMDKTLTDNVTVEKVPYFETHSETGITIYIASEA